MSTSAQAVLAVERVSAVPTMLRVITEITGLRLSLIAHVTDGEWTCCAVNDQLEFGLEVGAHLDVATTLCSEVRSARAPIVISHASADPTYCDHPTPRLYNLESYIAVPIFLKNGDYFGNVCALDSEPVDLTAPRTLALFQLFAELVGTQLDQEAVQAATSQALLDATSAAQLREQFIAVLGHDVRTPLQAIALGAEALALRNRSEDATVIERIGRSVGRITRLVDDVLDFARGRLGGGIPLESTQITDLSAVLHHVVDELRAVHPERDIAVRMTGRAPVDCDPVRLSQLLQNLLGNALAHSPRTAHVGVDLAITDAQVVLAVANGGPALPPTLVARMFEPYERGSSARPTGLGLGLYIAAQIVRSHGGTIAVTSTAAATTVTCVLPRLNQDRAGTPTRSA